MLNRRQVAQTAAALALPAWLRYARAEEAGVSKGAVHLATSMPLSGPVGGLGRSMRAGMQLVVDDVNVQGGVHGRLLNLHVADDAYDAQRAVANLRKSIDANELFACIAVGATPANQLAIPFLEERKIPYLAPFTGSSSVRLPEYTHTFHLRASYTDEVHALIDRVLAMGLQEIAVVYADTQFGESLRDDAVQALEKRKRTPKTVVAIKINASNAKQAADTVVAKRPAAVFLATSGRMSVEVIRHLKAGALKLPVFTTSVGLPPNAFTTLKGTLVGAGVMQVVPNPNQGKMKLVRSYQSAMRAAGLKERTVVGMEGYINMRVMVEALQRAGNNVGKELTRPVLLRALRSIRGWDLEGFKLDFGAQAPYVGSQYTSLGVVSRSGKLI